MSTLVTNELLAQPGRGDDVAKLLLEILGESLQHDGCETIRSKRRTPGRYCGSGARKRQHGDAKTKRCLGHRVALDAPVLLVGPALLGLVEPDKP